MASDLVAIFGSPSCSEAESAQREYHLPASTENLEEMWDTRRSITHAGTLDRETGHAMQKVKASSYKFEDLTCSTHFQDSTGADQIYRRIRKGLLVARSRVVIGTTTINS